MKQFDILNSHPSSGIKIFYRIGKIGAVLLLLMTVKMQAQHTMPPANDQNINQLLKDTRFFLRRNPSRSARNAESLRQYAIRLNKKELEIVAMTYLAENYLQLGNMERVKGLCTNGLEMAKKINMKYWK